VPDAGGRLFGGVDAGKHHARRAHVEHAAGADPLGGLHPDDRGHRVGRSGRDDVAGLLLGAGAVFEVEQDPVHTGCRAHFGGDGCGGAQEDAMGDLAAGEPSS
jgi:hypothetical protein